MDRIEQGVFDPNSLKRQLENLDGGYDQMIHYAMQRQAIVLDSFPNLPVKEELGLSLRELFHKVDSQLSHTFGKTTPIPPAKIIEMAREEFRPEKVQLSSYYGKFGEINKSRPIKSPKKDLWERLRLHSDRNLNSSYGSAVYFGNILGEYYHNFPEENVFPKGDINFMISRNIVTAVKELVRYDNIHTLLYREFRIASNSFSVVDFAEGILNTTLTGYQLAILEPKKPLINIPINDYSKFKTLPI